MTQLNIQENLDIQPKNTLAVPALARYFLSANTLDEVQQGLAWAQSRSLPLLILGGGSNIVLNGDFPGLVLQPQLLGRELISEQNDEIELAIGAGENWHELVSWTISQGWYGLENLALIPGSVGAAPIQNIGAYGIELAQFVSSVECLEIATGRHFQLSQSECQFGYRDSVFKHRWCDRVVITRVHLKLSRTPCPVANYPALSDCLMVNHLEATPQNIFMAVCAIRMSRLPNPSDVPNVGSFFKNPIIPAAQGDALKQRFTTLPCYPHNEGSVKIAAAWLIEYAGWKGRIESGIGMHAQQALVLVNPGKCSGRDILHFAQRVQNSVKETFGIDLEMEPRVFGAAS